MSGEESQDRVTGVTEEYKVLLTIGPRNTVPSNMMYVSYTTPLPERITTSLTGVFVPLVDGITHLLG